MIAFEEVYSWLNKFGPSHLRPSSISLIGHMKTALETNHPIEAAGLLQQLKDQACRLRDDAEVTEVFLECAETADRMGSLDEARAILVDTVSRAWSDLHRRAVIQWLLGAVQWRSMPARQQAVISWRNSISDFERLAKQPSIPRQHRAWYEETCRTLEQNLVAALEEVGKYMDILPSPGTTEATSADRSTEISATLLPSASSMTQPSDTLMPGESTITHTADILQLFTISEEIPAGDFGPSGSDPFPTDTVEIDRVLISGHPYSIHSTRGRRIINIPFDQKLIVVKVKGDSMNLENITEKDFVLLRKVDVPENGDIVLAEIVGVDSKATLKRYFIEKGTITLRPNSSNPIHQPFVFKKIDDGFYIRGVVVAVLKPS